MRILSAKVITRAAGYRSLEAACGASRPSSPVSCAPDSQDRRGPRPGVDRVAAPNPLQFPAMLLSDCTESLARDLLHNSPSTTWASASLGVRSAATSIQPSAASRIFA